MKYSNVRSCVIKAKMSSTACTSCYSTNNTDKINYQNTSKHHDNGFNDDEYSYEKGLLHYKKWWELTEVDVIVNGHMVTGVPVFTHNNTLRVVNDKHSYFIPLEKVDYIRTDDGLKQNCEPDC